MAVARQNDIIWLLIKAPMTAEMIFRASKSFRIPYTSLGNLRNDLKTLHSKGLLARQEVPSEGRGQKEFLYYPSSRVKRLPAFSGLSLPAATFRGFSGSLWHSEAISDLVSHVERGAGELRPRVRVVASIRDGYFHAPLEVQTSGGTLTTSLKPDHTMVIEMDGEASLFFVEVFNAPSLISPLSPQSVGRSVRFRMTKYKAFQPEFQTHPVCVELQRQLGVLFQGFRVLTVTTREGLKENLCSMAREDGYKTMFYFAALEDIQKANLFTDPIWSLPNGESRGLITV